MPVEIRWDRQPCRKCHLARRAAVLASEQSVHSMVNPRLVSVGLECAVNQRSGIATITLYDAVFRGQLQRGSAEEYRIRGVPNIQGPMARFCPKKDWFRTGRG